MFFVLGGHFARVDGVEDFLPTFSGAIVGDGFWEIVDAELALLFFGVVTVRAVLLEDCAVFLRKNG